MRTVSLKCFMLLLSCLVVHAVQTNAVAQNGCAVDSQMPGCCTSAGVGCDNSGVLGKGLLNKGLFNNGLMGNQSQCCKSLWSWGGWVESGIYANNHGQTNTYNMSHAIDDYHGIDPWSGNTQVLSNVRQSDLQVNQMWLYLEKKLNPCRRIDIGGRVDFMYGTDGWFLQSDGLERENGHSPWGEGDYFAAIPQAYLEVGNRTLNVRAGKFLSLLGYESAMAPNRFFYSLSYSYMTVPATMTGAVVNWNPNNKLSTYAGWISSHDSTFDSSHDSALVAGFKYQLTNRLNFGYGFMTGQEREATGLAAPGPQYFDDDMFIHSLVVNYKLGQRWDYTFAWNLMNQSGDFGSEWGRYCLAQELIYRINRCWAVGLRGEWVRDYDNSGVGLFGVDDHVGGYEITLGANWTPNKWLLIRPEIRYDEVSEGSMLDRPFNIAKGGLVDAKCSQLSGGVSCVVKF